MRRHNLALVLNQLASGTQSRAEIAAATGLTRSTTSSLVTDLIDWGLVREVGRAGRTGRPATLLEVDGSHAAAIGVEVNVGAVTTTAVDIGGRVIAERRHAVDNEQRPVNEAIEVVLGELVAVQELLGTHTDVIGIGLAIAGLVEARSGMVHVAPNLGWHDEQLGVLVTSALTDRFGDVPIEVDNEANFGALAEHTVGGAVGVDDFVYLLAERGVGGGIISGGQLMRGSRGYAGEIGHISVLPGGDTCSCGSKGCWETTIGLTAMLRRGAPDVADATLADPTTSPEEKIAVVVDRARSGDATALAALDETGRWLGVGVGILVDVLNPQRVVIAGALAEVAEWIVAPALETLRGETVSDDGGGCLVTTSSLGHRAPSLGAALRCVQRVRDDPALARR